MPTIHEREEGPRGCGYRKGGGTYLVSAGEMVPCGKLPLTLDVCPCCGAGIKPSRGWTWVNPQILFKGSRCPEQPSGGCCPCPLGNENLPDTAGLLWVGERYYSTPEKFSAETAKMGISRRLSRIPREFKLGETLVLLAHRKGTKADDEDKPAIFSAFRPTAIEYVVKGTETDEELDKLEERGFTLVRVIRKAPELPDLATRNSEDRRGKTRRLKSIAKFINENMEEQGYRAEVSDTKAEMVVYRGDIAVLIHENTPGHGNSEVEDWLEAEIELLTPVEDPSDD